jgi:Domain of unknown function (DUF5076)
MSIQDPDNPPPVFDALHVPPLALDRGGTEVLRAVVIDGDLHLSIRRAFEEPETWGMLLADLARHIGRIYAREGHMSEEAIVEKVCETFEAEMEEPSDPGTTNAVS